MANSFPNLDKTASGMVVLAVLFDFSSSICSSSSLFSSSAIWSRCSSEKKSPIFSVNDFKERSGSSFVNSSDVGFSTFDCSFMVSIYFFLSSRYLSNSLFISSSKYLKEPPQLSHS